MAGGGFFTFFGVVMLCLVCQCVDSRGSNCKSDPERHCAKVRCEYRHLLGTSSSPELVPDNPVKGPGMRVCFNGADQPDRTSCCTQQTEMNYVEAAKKDFRRNIVATNAYLKKVIVDNLKWHREQFLAMIEMAQHNTALLLGDMYRVPWEEMNDALKALFLDLQQYILHKNVNINLSVSKFFDDLFPIAFNHILNDPSLNTFTEDYTDCLTGIRQHLYPQPFGDIPHKMSVSLSKSLSKARLFLKGLNVILKAVNFTDTVSVDKECSYALTRLQYCSHCEGYTTAKPCKNFCVNVLRGCLAKIEELGQEWDELVVALEDVITHMKGPSSIFEVTQFLDTKVSSAIMHAMGIEHRFYEKVVDKCGRPNRTTEVGSKVTSPPYAIRNDKKTIVQIGDLETTLSSFMETVATSKGLYTRMADMLCNNTLFYDQSPTSAECWNGQHIGSYEKVVPEPSLMDQVKKNPEVTVSLSPDTQLLALKDELSRVKRMLTPQPTDDMMQADPEITVVGSGYKPRGRGYRPNGFEDDEDFVLSGSGSGDSSEDGNRKPRRKGDGPHYNTGKPPKYITDRTDRGNGGSKVTPCQITGLSILLSVLLMWKG